jgi:hypothetical protein
VFTESCPLLNATIVYTGWGISPLPVPYHPS